MFEIIAVTDRRLYRGRDFPERVRQIAASGVSGVILREKDLPPSEYAVLAGRVMAICRENGVELIAHTFADAAIRAGCRMLQLPLRVFSEAPGACAGLSVGVSVHSAEDARLAVSLGAGRLIAGHIFTTAGKEGVPPRGLDLLAEICRLVPVPVYAIGGVNVSNIREVKRAGAAGACLMSPFMLTDDPAELTAGLMRAAIE
jgi:thiamine-phosphate pyrophosphorylase